MKKYSIFILLLALTVRLAAAVYWERRVQTLDPVKGERLTPSADPKPIQDGPFFFGDSDSYWQLGRAIARGTPYQHDPARCWKVFRMPGYPTVLAPLFWFGGENPPVFWARLENVFFGTLTVFLTGLTAWFLFRKRSVALLSLLIVAFCPESIFQSVCVLSEESFCALNLILLMVMIFLVRSLKMDPVDADASLSPRPSQKIGPIPHSARRSVFQGKRDGPAWDALFGKGALLGSTAALTVYFRPEWLYFVPFAALFGIAYLGITRRFTQVDLAQMGLILLFGFLIFCFGLSPWWFRNLRVTGTFVPTTLQMGASLYDGLSPEADGGSRMDFVDAFRSEEIHHPEGGPTEREFLEVRLDKKMKRAALDWAVSHPKEAFRLAGVKFVRLWNFWPNEPSFSKPWIRRTIMISIVPILFFASIGFILTLKRGFVYWLLWIPALYVTALHVVFVSSLRYRGPILPGLIILAAFAVVTIYEKLRRCQTNS